MSNKVIKELQKLLALCMEINDRTEHDVNFNLGKTNGKQTFSIYAYINSDLRYRKSIATVEYVTLQNIDEFHQKLLKYKEW